MKFHVGAAPWRRELLHRRWQRLLHLSGYAFACLAGSRCLSMPNKLTPSPAELVAPFFAPKIDGVIRRRMARCDQWRGLHDSWSARSTRVRRFWFGCDGKCVYVAARTELPPDGKLQATANRRTPTFNDDSIEIWSIRFSRTAGDRRYFHHWQLADFWFDVA